MCFPHCFKGNLSSFEALIEKLIKLKQLGKEGYLFILRELAQFCSFILEVIVMLCIWLDMESKY